MTRTRILAVFLLVGGFFAFLLFGSGGSGAASGDSVGVEEAPTISERRDPPVASTLRRQTANVPRSVAGPSPEARPFSLERLRGLWVTEPERALVEAEVLEQEVTNAEERGEVRWIRARALVSLGRFSEARTLALAMKRAAPDSPFSVDVERHLLVHPLGFPARDESSAR